MRKNAPESKVAPGHPDFAVLSQIETDILKSSNGADELRKFFCGMLRDEIDKLIDTPNTDRRSYTDLEKVEKTYIGTRVEIRLRKFWGFPKGRLDLKVGHMDVDIKHTMDRGWMIPREAIGMPCILSSANETGARCAMGLIVAKSEYLTKGLNQDQKAQIAAAAWPNISWLIWDEPYPPNFWSALSLQTVGKIFEGKSGTERVGRLFREVQDTPIPRKVVIDVAQQLDPIKRLRHNGGARDALMAEGIVLLSGNYDAKLIEALRLKRCERGEFIAHKLANETERKLAKQHGLKRGPAR
ncbi:MAG: NaeI family type II restriction endonuclease [Micropepsaceae bacterium]